MVNGGIPGQITDFFTTIAGQATQNLLQKKQQESQRVNELATQLASSGQLGGLPAELQNSFKKTLGNELFETLQFQSGVAQQRGAPVEALRQGAIGQLQAPVSEQVGVVEGPPPSPLPVEGGAPTEVQGPGAPQPIFGERPPTDIEQFERLGELGPAGAALIGGPQLGQLVAGQASILSQQAARTAGARKLRNQVLLKLLDKGKLVSQPIPVAAFDPETVPAGQFPLVIDDTVFLVGAETPDFDISNDAEIRARGMGIGDKRDMTPAQALQIKSDQVADQIKIKAAQGENAAKLRQSMFQANPLAMNFPNHGFFDKNTGERLSDFANTGEVGKADKAGGVTQLSGAERDQLSQVKKGVVTFNLIAQHAKAIYGPGGIFEGLQASGRLGKGVEGAFARLLQTDPELARAKRTLDSLIIRVGREFNGAKGPLSDVDINNLQKGMIKLGGIPDSQSVAFGILDDMRNSIQGAAGSLLRNDKFQLPGLATLDQAEGRLVGSDEVLNQPLNASPEMVEALVRDLGGQQATQVRAFFENNPQVSFQEAQQIVGLMLLPPDVQSQVMAGQLTLQEAQAAQQQQPVQP